jgi:hypothetical protein
MRVAEPMQFARHTHGLLAPEDRGRQDRAVLKQTEMLSEKAVRTLVDKTTKI